MLPSYQHEPEYDIKHVGLVLFFLYIHAQGCNYLHVLFFSARNVGIVKKFPHFLDFSQLLLQRQGNIYIISYFVFMQRAFDAEIKVLTNFEEKKILRNFEKNLAD